MIFKCNKSRRFCYTLDAVIQVNELGNVFDSKFIDASNLGGLFVRFGDVVVKTFFMLFFGHFIDLTIFCLRKQKRLVTVLFLECPLLASSETHLSQIEVLCLVLCQEIPFRML